VATVYETTCGDGRGGLCEAIQIPWADVENILGHPHEGSSEDDEALVAYLLAHGAPDWVREAEGWVDEHGWGLIGPRLNRRATSPGPVPRGRH
jgi:hypothetical protein